MSNQTISRLLLRDRTRPFFGKAGLFAGLLAVLTVLAPLQIMAQGNGHDEATKRLFQAVYDNNLPAVQVSVTDGANIEAKDKNGLTPVDIAVDESFFDIAHFLLSVRNFRSSQSSVDTGQAMARMPKPAPKPPAPVVKKLSKAAARPAPPPIPAWPQGKPNPFDPGAIGNALPVLGKIRGNPPPKTVATVPPPEPAPAPKPEPGPSRKISKALKEVAETPPPPPMPSPPMALKPAPGLKQKLSPPPPPSEESPVTSAPIAGPRHPQENARPSSIDRLMDKVSKAMKEKPKAGKETEIATIKTRSLKPNAPPQAPVPRLHPSPGAPAADGGGEPPSGFIEKVSNFFLGLLSDTSTRPAAKTPEGPKPIEDDGGKWVVRDVETATKEATGKSGKQNAGHAPQQAALTEGKAPTASLSRYLTGIQLTLGRSVRLGVPQFAQGGAQSKPCIKKKNGALAFCIEDVDWPDWIKPYFQVNSIMYQGAKAIARYDNGVATSYHVIFPTGSYPAVVQYYTRKFGKPTKTLNRSIAPLAAPRRENPTAIWQSIDAVTKQITTLEVREFDDARGTFPDTKRGAVMLYQQWSSPIFPNLSTLELMILNAKARAKL
jgi:hypothetical protein